MNDRPFDQTPGDEAFAAELRVRLQSATAALEPTLSFDEVIGDVLDGRDASTGPRRTWARAGAIGLAAASLAAVLAWTVRSPEPTSVSAPSTPPTIASEPAASTLPPTTASDPTTSPTTVAPAEITEAVNILVVGVDNNACVDPDSPFAGGFGDRENMGERTDTIMIVRLDPSTERAAVLSFPRDLWVTIPNRGKGRINSAYVRDDPTRLLGAIYNNFGLEVDHFIQIDFCAFTTIVDGLGGVTVPFEHPARDVNTGLDVPQAGCFTFDGDHALAYVRSRQYEYRDANGTWQQDGLSDLGRISRQQDFLRRVLSAALDRGVTDPSVARALISAVQDNVVVDQNLTISTMLHYVSAFASLSPDDVSAFQIEGESATVSGNSVLLPRIDGDNMQSVLALFRGGAPLIGSNGSTGGPTLSDASASSAPSTTPVPEENPMGIVPPRDITC